MNNTDPLEKYIAIQKPNILAKNVFLELCRNPSALPSLLLVVGPSGSGKSTLVNAARNSLEKSKAGKIVFFQAEDFANKYVSLFQSGTHTDIVRFKKSIRNDTTFFFLDGIDFFYNKNALMAEVIKTTDFLCMNNAKVILTSNVDPKSISSLHPRYVSRLCGGLLLNLHSADLMERRLIFRKYCEERGVLMAEEIENYVAEQILSVRSIQGAANRLIALCDSNTTLSISECSILIRDLIVQHNTELNIQKIIDTVSDFYDVSTTALIGKSRDPDFVHARQIAQYLSYKLLNSSVTEIAKAFQRDHSTIMYSIHKVEKEILSNAPLYDRIDQLSRILLSDT
ncbi:MAG: AAA family ATPase [Lachnospiraceae bacterium]|nr:AAA family ATPase [Lachnospiraceae bacterium]